jgi:hypothetical protein
MGIGCVREGPSGRGIPILATMVAAAQPAFSDQQKGPPEKGSPGNRLHTGLGHYGFRFPAEFRERLDQALRYYLRRTPFEVAPLEHPQKLSVP